ncbi:hypothetical protein ElyMa_006997500 [Elysia marginata]|uniref:Uncharacterized protein n=1 Tax=Elysia marginata TaxID=1093978 RepID=A0AAV4JQI1_9GAST|nr:hypothetical protein ElyMa_006997500 [Elysia marginata]
MRMMQRSQWEISRRELFRVNSSGKIEVSGLNAKETKVMHKKRKDGLPDDLTEIVVNHAPVEKSTPFQVPRLYKVFRWNMFVRNNDQNGYGKY